jgi:superfamily II RNA helicase
LDYYWKNLEVVATTPKNSISTLLPFGSSEIVAQEELSTFSSLIKPSFLEEQLEFHFSENFRDLAEDESLKEEIAILQTDCRIEKTPTEIIDEMESSNSITFADNKSKLKRPDIKLKYSIRALRKYFRDQFRTHHAKLINKRIVNCTPKEIYNAVSDLLTNVLEFPDCDKDTIFYLIGILDLKQVNRMSCTQIIKNEVNEFLDCVRVFSKGKFKRIFKSKTLCKL